MLSSAANAVVDADLAVTPIRKRQVWKLLPTVAVLNMKVGWTAASVAAPPSLFFPQYVVSPPRYRVPLLPAEPCKLTPVTTGGLARTRRATATVAS